MQVAQLDFFSKTVTGLCAQTSVSLSTALPVCRSVALSLCCSVRPSACLPICQSPHLLSVYLFVRLASCLLSVLSLCVATYSLSRVLPPVRVFTVRLLSVLSHFLGLRFPQFCLLQDGELKCFVVFAPGLLPSTETTHISASLCLPPFQQLPSPSLPCFNDPMFVSSSSSSSECGQTGRLFGFFPSLCLADCSVVQLSCLVITIARSLGCFRRVAQLPSLSLIAGLMAMSIYRTVPPPHPLSASSSTNCSLALENQLMATV